MLRLYRHVTKYLRGCHVWPVFGCKPVRKWSNADCEIIYHQAGDISKKSRVHQNKVCQPHMGVIPSSLLSVGRRLITATQVSVPLSLTMTFVDSITVRRADNVTTRRW